MQLSNISVQWRQKNTRSGGPDDTQVVPELAADVASASAGGSAFLKILFINGEDSIVGDVRSAKIAGGKLVDSSKGETVIDNRRLVVSASRGLADETEFISYKFSEEPRWTIRVEEGSNYASGPWNLIANFELTGDLIRDEETGGAAGESAEAP